ncbi:uncharacterized protein LOC132194251 [Neocloeon triangulifer]|uniref:uncharacterized protein LOC132194251 n=1 Tax=Neocloeon triangulifer TaxID=2078957 RepID=UPI00286F5AD6|nr:uncharacterized protein LOC132194251 [Neocloeon triangulifer]
MAQSIKVLVFQNCMHRMMQSDKGTQTDDSYLADDCDPRANQEALESPKSGPYSKEESEKVRELLIKDPNCILMHSVQKNKPYYNIETNSVEVNPKTMYVVPPELQEKALRKSKSCGSYLVRIAKFFFEPSIVIYCTCHGSPRQGRGPDVLVRPAIPKQILNAIMSHVLAVGEAQKWKDVDRADVMVYLAHALNMMLASTRKPRHLRQRSRYQLKRNKIRPNPEIVDEDEPPRLRLNLKSRLRRKQAKKTQGKTQQKDD